MPLSQLGLSQDPFRVELLMPDRSGPLLDKKKKPAYVDILSTDTTKAKQLKNAARNRRMKAGKVTAEIIDDDELYILARLTTGWYLVDTNGDEITDDEGNSYPFTPENAEEAYSQDWLKEQVAEAAGNRANFMPKSPTA